MKKEKPIKTETGIYTKLHMAHRDDFVVHGKDGKVGATIRITDWALKEDEKIELERIISSIGEKPNENQCLEANKNEFYKKLGKT